MSLILSGLRRCYRCLTLVVWAGLFAAAMGNVVWASEAQAQRPERLQAAASAQTLAEASALPTARVVHWLPVSTGVRAVAWSPDGKLLATSGGIRQHLAVWDAQSGTKLWETVRNYTGDEALAFSNDGRLLIASNAETDPDHQHDALILWDAAKGTIAGHVAGPFPDQGLVANFARRIALDRSRNLLAVIAAAEPGEPVGIYDMENWTLKAHVVVERHTPTAVAFAADGTLAAGTVGDQIAFFDARTRTLKRIIKTGYAPPSAVIGGGIASLAYSPDGKYIASGANFMTKVPDPIRVWRCDDGTLVRSYVGARSTTNGLAWSPDGHYLASAIFDNTIRLWAADTAGPGEIVDIPHKRRFSTDDWRSVAFNPDGTLLAAGGGDGAAVISLKP